MTSKSRKKPLGMIMEKVIFLDVYGVLNSNFWNEDHQKEISVGKYIDSEKVK